VFNNTKLLRLVNFEQHSHDSNANGNGCVKNVAVANGYANIERARARLVIVP